MSDILVRDSLFRQAYRLELQALKDGPGDITVNNHILSDGLRGRRTTPHIEEALMFGVPDGRHWPHRKRRGGR